MVGKYFLRLLHRHIENHHSRGSEAWRRSSSWQQDLATISMRCEGGRWTAKGHEVRRLTPSFQNQEQQGERSGRRKFPSLGGRKRSPAVHWHLWSCSPIGSHQLAAAQPGSFIHSEISLCFLPQQSVPSALPLLRNFWPQGLCPSHLEPETMKIKQHVGSFPPPPLMVWFLHNSKVARPQFPCERSGQLWQDCMLA